MSQSELPVMWDAIESTTTEDGVVIRGDVENFHHVPGGVNALYMDGHVEWVHYPSKYPSNPEVATVGRGY